MVCKLFILTPNGKGPIILIGGMNGAGKTTLLDAVRLCLYGRRALGNRNSRNEYYEYLSALIHHGPDSVMPLNHAAVSLEFDYAHGNETRRYRIERSWRQYGLNYRTLNEDLTISENDLLDTEFGAEHWQDRIEELIPMEHRNFSFLMVKTSKNWWTVLVMICILLSQLKHCSDST